jgi:starch synthase
MAVRLRNKLLLQLDRGLTLDPDVILFAMIHRITEQKGFQLVLDASEGLFRHLKFQAVIGGNISSGDQQGEEIAHGLYLLSTYYPGRVSVTFGFQNVSAPLLSADLFCMPSMNEPGGISQLEAMAAGCLVVARATGGLRDTVFPLRVSADRVEGNGFLFTDFNASAFYDAMNRARDFFAAHNEMVINRARMNAEKSVYFWDRPARNYIEEMYKIKEIIRFID